MGKRKFIINTITHWNEPPRARHQVAQALAKEHQVVFVTASKIGFPRIKLAASENNLDVFIPYFPINYKIRYRISFLNQLYQKWLYGRLRKRFGDHIMINFDFTARLIHRYFPHPIYYCNDDHVGLSYKRSPHWIARYQDSCEKTVISSARLCVGTSAFLANRMGKLNASTHEIRLGAPHIEKLPETAPERSPVDRDTIHVGIVGYVRTIDNQLVEFLHSKPDVVLTLVGPVTKSEKQRYSHLLNIHITGSLVGQELYEAVSRFDIGLIPYHMRNTIDRTPNKLWLYLALGKPVVISNIKGIRDWTFPDHFVYRSDSQEAFYELIRLACSEDNHQLTESRIRFAMENTWDVRMADFLKIVDSHFPGV